MSRNVSIKDIALAAGVSHTTVSRALRNSPLISEEVRKNIQQITQEMGYVPNTAAQSLKTNRTHSIGLIVTTIADPFVGRVVRGIEEVARQYHHSVFLSASYNNPENEMEIIRVFRQRHVDGIIIAASKINAEYEQDLLRLDIPIILINHQTETQFQSLHSVCADDYSGARKGVEYLTQLGHRRIGYLGAGNRPRSNRIRLQAYRDVLASSGVEAREEWVAIASPEHHYHSDDVSDGMVLSNMLIQSGVTALFCYNDMLAVGAMLTCRSQGIPVPAKISILGFDDIELAQYLTPPITTIHQPKLRLGQLAMEMLLDLLANRPVENAVLPTELIVRDSTGPSPRPAPSESFSL
jgi:DNA-binding LacI/PurR family transcriptional regulator